MDNDDFRFERVSASEVKTNVPHRISYRSPNDFSMRSGFNWGYMGTGSHELSANILWIMNAGTELECIHKASKFSDEVLNYLPHEGGTISRGKVSEWIKVNMG